MGKVGKRLNVGLQLIIENPGSAEAVLPISWCVSPKTLETITRQKILNPHLLLVIASVTSHEVYWEITSTKRSEPDEAVLVDSPANETEPVFYYKEVKRLLLPLKQGMEYVEINKSGKYRIFATIVGDDCCSVEDLRSKIIGKNRDREIITPNGEFMPPRPSLREAISDIEVGKDFFAHLPSEWESAWVNRWFDEPAKNQCQFRRRRIVAYSVQPIAMGAFFLIVGAVELLVAIFLLFGGRMDAEQEARAELKKQQLLAAALSKQQSELGYLQCSLASGSPSIKRLPHPTIRLRYLAVKAKVCRPFTYS